MSYTRRSHIYNFPCTLYRVCHQYLGCAGILNGYSTFKFCLFEKMVGQQLGKNMQALSLRFKCSLMVTVQNNNCLTIHTVETFSVLPGRWLNEVIQQWIAECTRLFFIHGNRCLGYCTSWSEHSGILMSKNPVQDSKLSPVGGGTAWEIQDIKFKAYTVYMAVSSLSQNELWNKFLILCVRVWVCSVTFSRDQHSPLLAALQICWNWMCPLKPCKHYRKRTKELYRKYNK